MNWFEWMKNVKTQPLNEICFLGSHDSGAFILDFDDTPVLKSEPFPVRKLKFIHGVESAVKDWTLTQDSNFYFQCMNGIRVFDIRISMPADGSVDFWVEHSYGTIKLKHALTQLHQFTIENPSEILIIWFAIEDYPFLFQEQLLELWKPYYDLMFDFQVNKTTQTVSDLLENKVRWVVYGNLNLPILSHFFGDYAEGIISPWIDTNNAKTKMEGLKLQLAQTLPKTKRTNFYALPWTLTPQAKTDLVPSIISNVLCCCCKQKSLQTMAKSFNSMFKTFSEENQDTVSLKVNVVFMDYPELDTFIYDFILQQNNIQTKYTNL